MLMEQLNGVDPRKRVKAEENRLSQSKNKSENEQEDVKKEKNIKKKKTSSTVIFISSATEDSEGPEMEARRQEE